MEDMSSTKNNNKIEEENSKSKSRVKSLDTFRGITIALMIFVNDGAGGMHMYHSIYINFCELKLYYLYIFCLIFRLLVLRAC